MEKAKRFDAKSIVILSILILTLIITVIGMCIPWIVETLTLSEAETNKIISSDSTSTTLNDYFKNGLTESDGFLTMFSLALVTVLLNASLIASYIISKFIDTKKFVPLWCIFIIMAVALLICSVLSAAFTNSHINAVYLPFNAPEDLPENVKLTYKCTLGAGPWLSAVFGVVGGVAGLFAFCNLAFGVHAEK